MSPTIGVCPFESSITIWAQFTTLAKIGIMVSYKIQRTKKQQQSIAFIILNLTDLVLLKVYHSDNFKIDKAELLREGIIFLIHLFARATLLI